MNKYISSVLITAVLSVCFFTHPALADIDLFITSGSGIPGDPVPVKIKLNTGTVPGAALVVIDITFDNANLTIDTDQGSPAVTSLSNKVIDAALTYPDELRVILYCGDTLPSTAIPVGTDLIEIPFRIKTDSCTDCEAVYTVESSSNAADSDAASVPLTGNSGSISIASC